MLYYSVLKLFTGFAIAAFIAWKLIVASAIMTAKNPAAKNNHQLILMRYAKSCSHLCMINHASGDAITKATITSLIKSLDRSMMIFDTEAPSILRTPISFVRCAVANNDKPINPRQAMKIAKHAKIENTFPKS